MARTRGVSARFSDGGELLGKGGVPLNPQGDAQLGHDPDQPIRLDKAGNYISPAAAYISAPRNLSGNVVLYGPGAEPLAQAPRIVAYRADRKSWAKNMEAHELALLLDMAFANPGDLGDGFVVQIATDQFATVPGDLRRHFLPVYGDVK